MLESGQRLGGRYVLLQRLGAGGMGEVWLAQQEGSGTFRRRVVVKCIPPERRDDERLANMLHDEARILGLLHHPGIVAPIDFIDDEGSSLLVLEHVDGPSLRTALKMAVRSQQPLAEFLAAWIGAEIARALQTAHGAVDESGKPLALVHRDVSPDNVLLSKDGRVRLADFGVARALGNMDITNPGSAPKGKRGYMAPEQAAAQQVGPAADQFSLGRVIAEAADLQCGPKLRAVLDRATEHAPGDRFPSALALADALAAAVPPPPDVQVQLASWLQLACAESFNGVETSAGSSAGKPRKPFVLQLDGTGAPIGVVTPDTLATPAASPLVPSVAAVASNPPRATKPELFAYVDDRARTRSRHVRIVAATGVLLAIALPLALLFAEERGVPIGRALFGIHAPSGDLRIGSSPDGAEVYVDGKLRGVTPLGLHLSAGRHAVRVGSLRLERWHAADVDVRAGTEKRLEVDLSQ